MNSPARFSPIYDQCEALTCDRRDAVVTHAATNVMEGWWEVSLDDRTQAIHDEEETISQDQCGHVSR